MNENQLTIAANSVCGLADVTGCVIEDLLNVLVIDQIITYKDKKDIIERIESV